MNAKDWGPTEVKLRSIKPVRGRYTSEQVNQIREAYLLDGVSLEEIQEQVWPKSTTNALWRIAIGRCYPAVPLSERLAAAHRDAAARRQIHLPPRQKETAPQAQGLGAPAWRTDARG